jgi:hypothetical protein
MPEHRPDRFLKPVRSESDYGGIGLIGRAPDCVSGRCGFESRMSPLNKMTF